MIRTTTVLSRVTIGTLVFATACARSAAEDAAPASRATEAAADQAPCKKGKVIDMAKLAWLAEQADGLRNHELSLVIDSAGDPQLRKGKPGNEDCDTKVKVMTVAKPHTEVDTVTIHAKGELPVLLPSDSAYDAVFWTQSSVDKFVWPYYHSHRLWDAQLDTLKTKFENTKTAFAIAHQAPSKPSIHGSTSPASELRIGRINKDGKAEWVDAAKFLR